MSLVRRTSVAAVAVTALVLSLVMTLVASGASGSVAEPQRGVAKTHQQVHKQVQKQAQKAQTAQLRAGSSARWVSGFSRSGTARTGLQTHRTPARLITFRDRKLGGQPVLAYRGAADPTVARYPGGWVAISTGPGAPRAIAPQPGGPWQNIPSALTTQPSWALTGRYWASDLVQVNGLWLLYFSAEVAGLGLDGRCIGVATATDPTGAFVPDERPLVCPRQAVSPSAYDRIKRRDRGMPKDGVIDPEYFKDRGGRDYLMYRTQGTPSSIRIVKLPADGRPGLGKARSSELVRRNGVIENPTMVRRGRQYVLLTSEGDFGECSYKTTYRRSGTITDFSRSKRGVLIDGRKSGLCGPGGADLGRGASGEPMLFFHAWTCPELGGNCPTGHNYDRDNIYGAQRSMFAATLRYSSRQAPKLEAYVAPILPPPPPPTTPPPTTPPPTVRPRGR